MRRRALGITLCLCGAAALSASVVQYASGAVRADRVRREWEASQARRAVANVRNEIVDRRLGHATAEGAPVARLVIPRLGIDEIVVEGISERALNVGPGHFPGSAYPGEPGNSVISAHRDRHFSRLGRLAIGDTIVTESGHIEATWRVVQTRVIDREAPALFRTSEATLTLTTCWPIRFFGTAPDRFIVTAKRI